MGKQFRHTYLRTLEVKFHLQIVALLTNIFFLIFGNCSFFSSICNLFLIGKLFFVFKLFSWEVICNFLDMFLDFLFHFYVHFISRLTSIFLYDFCWVIYSCFIDNFKFYKIMISWAWPLQPLISIRFMYSDIKPPSLHKPFASNQISSVSIIFHSFNFQPQLWAALVAAILSLPLRFSQIMNGVNFWVPTVLL